MKIKRILLLSFLASILLINSQNIGYFNSVQAETPQFACSGTVSGSDTGDPIYGATVKLYWDDSGISPTGIDVPQSSGVTLVQTTSTDALGRYSVSYGAISGTFIVEISKSNYQTSTRTYVEIGTYVWNPVLTAVSSPFTCTGYVTMIGGSPISSATVRVKTESGTTIASDSTDSNGYYSVTVSNPDSYSGTTFTVEAVKTYFGTQSSSFTKSGSHTKNFQLQCSLGMHYYGYVKDSSGTPIQGATVSITNLGSDTTDSSGKYDIIGDSADYVISPFEITKSGYQDYHSLVEISSGDQQRDATLSYLPSYELQWSSPAAGTSITFGPGSDPFLFNFSYTYNDISDVHLFLNDHDYGSVWGDNQISLSYDSNIDGDIVATLVGYDGSGTEQVSSVRNFHFTWIYFQANETLETGSEIMPQELYTIIHDPCGDGSTSTFEQSSTFTLGVGVELTAGATATFEIGAEGSLFGVGVGASTKLSLSLEASLGYDFEYEMTTSDELSSSDVSDDPDFIGPGYGDIYWGEGWTYIYNIVAKRIEYFNGTIKYTEPKILYGIERSSELIVNSLHAPQDWKDLNPVLNGYDGVIFDDQSKTFDGGHSYTFTRSSTTTNTLSQSLTITLTDELKTKIGCEETTLEISVSLNVHGSESWENMVQTSYTLADDEPTDIFMVEIGTDPLYGTPIFKTVSENSLSSAPLEYDTIDYIPPEILNPIAYLDSDGVEPSPSQDDTPKIRATITDEGGIATAKVYYSIDGGNFYYHVDMTQIPDTDLWEANIPSQDHGTTVYWYIRAGDNSNHYSNATDEYGNPFTYTVVNRNPSVSLISPNGGQTYSESIQISWTGSDQDADSLTYSLGYSFDGTIWNSIATNLVGNTYMWDISSFSDKDTVIVRVIAYDGYGGEASDESDFAFAINNPDVPSVNYLTPLGGFSYSGIISISWEVTDIDGFITSFDLAYSSDNGVSWTTIVSDLSSSVYSYDWNSSSLIYSNQVKLRIIANYEIEGTPDATFDLSGIMTIDNRPNMIVSLISPNGGERFEDSVSIAWDVNTLSEVVYESTLEYTVDGSTYNTIATGLTGTNYVWNTHSIPYGTNYRIRVTVSGTYLGYTLTDESDISNGAFTIDPDVLAPEFTSTPSNHVYEFAENGHTLIWTATDRNPKEYSLKRNGEFLYESVTWTTSPGTFEFSLDGLAVGDYTYEFSVMDIWDQISTDTVYITITDSSAPIFHFNTPTNGSSFELGTNIEYSYTASDPSSYSIELKLNGLTISDTGVLSGLNPGSYSLVGYATDVYNNIAIERIDFMVIDSQAPIVEILNPSDGFVFEYGSDVSYDYTVSDLDSFTTAVFLNGVEITDNGMLSSLAIGSYTLTVNAVDNSGNTGSDSISFTISDTTAPIVEIILPTDASVFEYGSDVSYDYTVSDLDSFTTEVFLNGVEITDNGMLSSLAIGSYTLTVNAVDGSGNTGSDSISFTISDTTAPVVEITLPANSSVFEFGSDVSYSYSVSDLDSITISIYLNGIEITDTGVLSNLAIGSYTLTVNAVDSSGSTSSDSITFSVLDTTDPVVSILSPEFGSVAEFGENVEYSYEVTDLSDYSITVLLNGDEIIDSGIMNDLLIGNYTLRIVATDEQGNSGYDEIVFSVVDSIAPIINILSPINGTIFEFGESITYSYEFSDMDDVIIELLLNGDLIEDVGTFEGLNIGEYNLEIRGTDNSGNVGTDMITFVVVDTTAPVVVINSPEGDSTLEFGLNITYTYEVSSEQEISIHVFLNEEEIEDTGILTGLELGEYTLTVEAVDGYGNTGSDSVTFIVQDTIAPEVSILTPENGEEFAHESSVSYSYSISDLNEYEVYIYLDSNLIEDTGIFDDLSDGEHTLRVVAIDLSDNTGFSEITFIILEDSEIQITVTSPNGGEIVSDLYNITWEIVNPQALDLCYNLYYSLDNGITWISIVNNTSDTYYYWSTNDIEGTFTNSLIKVEAHIVSDSIILSEDTSDYTFTIVNQAGGGIPGYSGLTLGIFGLFTLIAVYIFQYKQKHQK
ncbi:hypothetical protein [Candidatus Harpocratesius sp.]